MWKGFRPYLTTSPRKLPPLCVYGRPSPRCEIATHCCLFLKPLQKFSRYRYWAHSLLILWLHDLLWELENRPFDRIFLCIFLPDPWIFWRWWIFLCLLEKVTRGMPSPRLANRQSYVSGRIRKIEEVKVIIVLEGPWFRNYVDAEFQSKIFLLVYALPKETDAGCDVIIEF